MSNLSDKALEVAHGQLGATEHPVGSNWGEPVKTYLASVGIDFPASWCMAFMYWCFEKAAEELKIPNPLVKTAGVLRAWDNAVSHRVTIPQPGDIFIMDFGSGHGHTGIVTSQDISRIYTIEGNTNDTGSREGYEVCQRKRVKTSIKGYLRY